MDLKEYIKVIRESLVATDRRIAVEEILRSPTLYDGEVVTALCDCIADVDYGVRDIAGRGLMQIDEVWKDLVCENLAKYTKSTNIEVRNMASDILLKIKPNNITPLIDLFLDNNCDNVKFAIDIAGQIATPDYIDLFLDHIQHYDSNVRCSVVEAVGNIFANFPENNYDKAEIIKVFEEAYWSDEDLKPFIIEALGKLGGKEAQDFLINLISDEPNFFLRVAAVDALADCSDDIGVCYTLLDLLPTVNDELKIIFLKTIYAIAFRLGVNIELPDKFRYVAQLALLDNNPDSYGAGLVALGSSYLKEDVPYLLKIILRNDSEIQKFMIRNLMNSSEPIVIEEFIKAFFHKFDLTDSENLDFFSFIIKETPYSPEKNVTALVKSLVKNTINNKPVYWENIISTCFDISKELTIKELEKMKSISDASDEEFLNELLTRFEINL